MKIIKQNQIEINFGVGDRNKKCTTGAQQQICTGRSSENIAGR